MRRIIGLIIKADHLFHLFDKNDRIMVGVSGGKDSSLLYYALKMYANKVNREQHMNIQVFACHVKLNFGSINFMPYEKWLDSNDLAVKFIDSDVAEVLQAKMKNNKMPCSLCSKMKKAILIREAKKQKCNKIALGHHVDDAIETLFLNFLNEGRLATFQPVNYLSREKITMIRPFVLVNEQCIITLTKKLQIPVIKNLCPNDTTTQRIYLKKFIQKHFYDNPLFPNAYANFRNALMNGKNAELWFDNNQPKKDLLRLYRQNLKKKIN